MSKLRIEYKSKPERGEPFLKAEGSIEVMYPSEYKEIKRKLFALGIKSEDMKVYLVK